MTEVIPQSHSTSSVLYPFRGFALFHTRASESNTQGILYIPFIDALSMHIQSGND